VAVRREWRIGRRLTLLGIDHLVWSLRLWFGHLDHLVWSLTSFVCLMATSKRVPIDQHKIGGLSWEPFGPPLLFSEKFWPVSIPTLIF